MIQTSQSFKPERLTQPVTERDRVQGLLSAAIVLVEYGDYQCPHCQEAHAVIKQVQQQLGSELCIVFRHFPLTQIHPQAQQAAEAAKVASESRDVLANARDAICLPARIR